MFLCAFGLKGKYVVTSACPTKCSSVIVNYSYAPPPECLCAQSHLILLFSPNIASYQESAESSYPRVAYKFAKPANTKYVCQVAYHKGGRWIIKFVFFKHSVQVSRQIMKL